MNVLIPKGFRLIAKTDIQGTGAVVKGYKNPENGRFYFTIKYWWNENGEVQEREIGAGPFEKRLLDPLRTTISDVLSGPNNFIEERE